MAATLRTSNTGVRTSNTGGVRHMILSTRVKWKCGNLYKSKGRYGDDLDQSWQAHSAQMYLLGGYR